MILYLRGLALFCDIPSLALVRLQSHETETRPSYVLGISGDKSLVDMRILVCRCMNLFFLLPPKMSTCTVAIETTVELYGC